MSLYEKLVDKELEVPKDLMSALRRNKRAWTNFESFGPSHRRRYLIWLLDAKRPETRKRRIEEAVTLISRNEKNLLK